MLYDPNANEIAQTHLRLIKKISEQLHVANTAVAKDTAAVAKEKAPVDTGELRDSIYAKDITSDPMQPAAEIHADADHASFVNWGTSKMAPQPFMTEAIYPLTVNAAKLVAKKMK